MRDPRPDFPILQVPENGKRLVYLDSAATAQRPIQVMKAVESYAFHDNANPNRGVYELDSRATARHETARKTVADFLNVSPDEIIFTQNATEGFNLVAYSWGLEFLKEGDEILIAISEHHSNMVPWQRVAKATGAVISYLYPGPDGLYTQEQIDKAIRSTTKLVAIAQVSNVLGSMAPVEAVIQKAHAVGALVMLDIAQSVPHVRVDLRSIGADFASFSGHKIYGPMGIGALYIRRDLMEQMPPFLTGGDMIASVHEAGASWAKGPRKFEAGTRNVHGEVGLEASIQYMLDFGMETIRAHEQELMRNLMLRLEKNRDIEIIGTHDPDLRYGVLSFNVRDVHPHDVATLLDYDGIAVRAGHHCAQPLMEFLGIMSCVRVSFGIYTTEEDIDLFAESVTKVRRLMGYE